MNEVTIPVLRALSEVLTAAVAMTAFSVWLFSLQFVRRKHKLAIALVPVLFSVTIIYSADALETMAGGYNAKLMWQLIHWTGFVILPTACLWFSMVVLEMTGRKISRGMIVFALIDGLIAGLFLWLLWSGQLFSDIRVISGIGTTMVQTEYTELFWVYFVVNIGGIFLLLSLALSRTRTQASRRRMIYLIIGIMGIIIGTFPLLLFGSGSLISRHPTLFWFISCVGNALVVVMVVMLGYAAATFSVPWSDRLTRLRMIEWMLRGPVTASFTLWLVTMINRSSDFLGLDIAGVNTLATVVSIILLEYLITLIMPRIERGALIGLGKEDYAIFNEFQGMMVFKPELITYLEALTGALCDRFQARDGFFAVMDENGTFDPIIKTGTTSWNGMPDLLQTLPAYFQEHGDAFFWDETGVMIPVYNHDGEMDTFLGVLGLADLNPEFFPDGNEQVLEDALSNARTVLWQRRYLTTAYQVLRTHTQTTSGGFHSGSVLNEEALLTQNSGAELNEVSVWVKDALTHYWGGPRLAENPLLQWQIVRQTAAANNETEINALRSVLKQAAESLRPEGERSTNSEWMLYNLIDYKFFEKMRVKDLVRKLSMSEADFYRKQKVAVEALSRELMRMEAELNE